jgi:hypothetical protein
MILLQMLSRPDIRFRSALKDELKNLPDYEGVTGLTSFHDNGDVWKKLYLLRIKGGKFIELEHTVQKPDRKRIGDGPPDSAQEDIR